MNKLTQTLTGLCAAMLISLPAWGAAEPRVIVADFEIAQQGGWWDGGGSAITARDFASALDAKRSNFEVIHRAQLEIAAAKQGVTVGKNLNVRDALRHAKLVDADYVMTGTVIAYMHDISKKSGGGTLGNLTLGGEIETIEATIELRVIDPENGRIVHVREINDRVERKKGGIVGGFRDFTFFFKAEDRTPVGEVVASMLGKGADYFDCVMIKQTTPCLREHH